MNIKNSHLRPQFWDEPPTQMVFHNLEAGILRKAEADFVTLGEN